MPHADDAALDAASIPTSPPASTPSPDRSPRLVRALLVGACGVGLVGVGLGSGPATSTAGSTTSTLSITTAASTTAAGSSLLAEAVPHGAPMLLAPAPARSTAPRATRSRPAPKKKPAASTGKKAAFVGGWVRPSYAGVVSSYGMRWGRMHKGVDFGAGYGASIRAVGDGVVVGTGYQGSESGYGIITIIRHSNGYYSAYAHQSRDVVSVGQKVHRGDVIGYVGSTGHSTGAHLHFEIRTSMHGGQVNPLTYLRKHGVRV